MDAIRTYLDNVFAAFPKTEQVQSLRREMLASMEEKYHALKAEGKSEHEAVGSVIANFGSIDEIAAELGLEPGRTEPKQEREESGISLSRTEAEEYIKQLKACGLWVGLGVWLIMTCVAALLAIENTGRFLPLFIAVAIAVPMFVINGIRSGHYEIYQEKTIRLDDITRAEMEAQNARYTKRFTIQLSIGIALIILAVGAFLFVSMQRDMSWGAFLFAPAQWDTSWAVALLLLVIGFSVFLIIAVSIPKGAYDILLGKGEYRNKVQQKKVERLISTIAGVYWPLATASYLLWSFLTGAWHISWIIWPIAGVAFGAIAGGIAVWFGMEEE